MFEPLAPGFIHVHTAHCYRCPFRLNYPDCDLLCARTIGDVIRMEGPETVAALIVEPIGNTGGVVTPPAEYLPILREICDEFNILLIFDEIITGFGRTGQMFAADTFGVTPDIICMGKGITSGYAPLSAIEEVIERDLPRRAREMGAYLRQRLEGLTRYGIVGEVRGKGLLLGVELVKDVPTKEPYPPEIAIGMQIGHEAMHRGLILRHDPDWLALAPPLVVSQDELDEMMAILEASIGTVLERL